MNMTKMTSLLFSMPYISFTTPDEEPFQICLCILRKRAMFLLDKHSRF